MWVKSYSGVQVLPPSVEPLTELPYRVQTGLEKWQVPL
jgi:hypothetical protein